MTTDDIVQRIENSPVFVPPQPPGLVVYTARQLLELDIPPREYVIDPILSTGGLAMLFAPRGVGKTWIALGIACAVATGAPFLRWQAPRARRVLYLDGEMPAITIQERLSWLLSGMGSQIRDQDDYLRIVTPDVQTGGMPNIAEEDGQALIEPHLDGIDLLIVDNLACFVRSGKSNEEEGWRPIQMWALGLRRRGIAVLFVHHAGKGGDQRGSSAREDVLDTVIKLSRTNDYNPIEGANFTLEFVKARGIFGEHAASFEVKLETRDGAAIWTTRSAEDRTTARIVELQENGLKQREIATELGVGLGTVNRHLKKWKESSNAR